MKFFLSLLLFLSASARATGEHFARRGQFEPLPTLFSQEELNQVLFSEARMYREDLRKVKYFLVNGELQLAKVYLEKLNFGQPKLRPIAHRYLGIIAFIEQDYRKTLKYLNAGVLKDIPHYSRVCGVIVLSQIALNELKTLRSDWDRCRTEAAKDINVANFAWLDALVNLKLDPRPGVTSVPFRFVNLQALDNEDLKILLKLSLYLNQETLIADKLINLLPDQLLDREVRELAGHIFYRSRKYLNAFNFIEDIKSPNAESIKGNLYILRGKYELAYAQFKLALKEKQNSQNALERLVPITWLLGDWKSGADYARQLVGRSGAEANKLAVMAAFEMQAGNYNKAREHIREIRQKSRRGTALEVGQIASFSALMENDEAELRTAASQSCQLHDMVNCWVLYQLPQWGNFALVVRRGDEIPRKEDWSKLTQEKLSGKLTEQVYVYQQDIEELDDQDIKLIK